MARSGRFGRLPSEAPDLTASIVAMMEQWTAARDRNIIDAWKNGGEFEGSPVTDQRLLRHLRDRRSDYSRDDPEWDEYNNLLWQYRFSIAEQKALLNYERANARAAGIDNPRKQLAATNANSQAMAGFYKQWARRLPQNSAAYRDLMKSAAQFTKAAQAAASRSRGLGKKKPDSPYEPSDYDIYMQRQSAIDRERIEPLNTVMEALNRYARSQGFIGAGETISDLSVIDSATFEGMLSGIEGDPAWPFLKNYLRQNMPKGTWDGRLDFDLLDTMANRAKGGIKQKIRNARAYPGDRSSDIRGYRDDLRSVNALRRLDTRFDARSDIITGYDTWQENRLNAEDPTALLEGDAEMVEDLEVAFRKAMRGGDEALAGDIRMSIEAIKGNTDALRGLEGQDLRGAWGSGDLMALAQGQQSYIAARDGLNAGTHYLKYNAASASYTERTGGELPPPKFAVASFTEQPPDQMQFIIPRQSDDGHYYPMVVTGKPVYIDDDDTPDMYRAEYDSHAIYKKVHPGAEEGVGGWRYFTDDAFEATGMNLTPVSGGWRAMNANEQTAARLERLVLSEAERQSLTGTEADLFTEEEMGAQELLEQRAQLRQQLLMDAGIYEVDGRYIPRTGLGGSTVTENAIQQTVAAIDARLDTEFADAAHVVDSMVYGTTGADAARAQTALMADNSSISWSSSVLAAVNVDPATYENFGEQNANEYLQLAQYEPGMTDAILGQVLNEAQITMATRREGVQSAVRAAANGSLSHARAGFEAGASAADRRAMTNWDLLARAVEPEDMQRQDQLVAAGYRTHDKIGQVRDVFKGITAIAMGKTPPTARADLPTVAQADARARTTPDVVMASSMAKAARLEGLNREQLGPGRSAPKVAMPANLSMGGSARRAPKAPTVAAAVAAMGRTAPTPYTPAPITSGASPKAPKKDATATRIDEKPPAQTDYSRTWYNPDRPGGR